MLLVVLAAALGTAGTGLDRQALRFLDVPGRDAVPEWTRPCWRRLDSRHPYTLPCGRVVGAVVLRQLRDPDGDGDAHLVLAVRTNLVIVKLPRRSAERVGLGARVRAVGELDRGRLGRPVIRAQHVQAP